MSGTVEQVRVSLAFRNTCEAMDTVFGSDGWRVNTIWPDQNPDDYIMSVDIGGVTAAAYLAAGQTYTVHDGWGPGGFVSVSVPIPGDPDHWVPGGPRFFFPDKVTGDTVDHVAGTPEEQEDFRWGASGKSVDRIVKYLRILKRYLDQRGASQSGESEESPTPPSA